MRLVIFCIFSLILTSSLATAIPWHQETFVEVEYDVNESEGIKESQTISITNATAIFFVLLFTTIAYLMIRTSRRQAAK